MGGKEKDLLSSAKQHTAHRSDRHCDGEIKKAWQETHSTDANQTEACFPPNPEEFNCIMETKRFPKSIFTLVSVVSVLSFVGFSVDATAGTALYTDSSDAIQIEHAKVSHAEDGIHIAADFMVSVDLPGATESLVGGPGDFTYTWSFASVSPTPSSNTMFCGPILSINGNTYGWLYGSKDGVLSMRATGGHAKEGKPSLSKSFGDPVSVSQMPAAVRIRRESGTLYFEYTYSPMMPYQTGDSLALGADASASVTYQIMWSSVNTVLSSIEVTGPMVPDLEQTSTEGESEGETPNEGEAEGETEGEDVLSGYGVAQYTDARDGVKIEEEGVTYEEGVIHLTGSPYFTLPRKGGYLEDIPAGDFSYTVYLSYIGTPTFPMGFAGISVVVNGFDYIMLYKAGSPSGMPLQIKASRGMMGGTEYSSATLMSAPTAMRITRNGNILTWQYATSGLEDDFSTLASVDLSDPLGDATADDSAGTAKFDVLAFLDMGVSHIEVEGTPMYTVNDQYPFGPDAEVPATNKMGLTLTAAFLAIAGAIYLLRRSLFSHE